MTAGPSSSLNSGRASSRVSPQVMSPEPPAVGLSPVSLMKYGSWSEARASSRMPSKVPVGATKSKSPRAFQKPSARRSAPADTAARSVPVTTTAARLRGSSAQA